MVLLDDNFASIVNAVEEGRAVFDNIRKFLTYILAHNVPELIPYLAFVLFKIPLALTPIQTPGDRYGHRLAYRPRPGCRKTRPAGHATPAAAAARAAVELALALRAYLFLGLIEAVAAMAAFFFVLYGGGWKYGQACRSMTLFISRPPPRA